MRYGNRIKIILPALLFVAVGVLTISHAQPGGIPITQPPTNINILQIFDRGIGLAFGFLIILAVVFVIYAAYLYLTAGGDPGKVQTATRVIAYAAAAVVVGALARGIVSLVRFIIGF